MLSELYVENFALIEKANVTFDEGFNVITGETGAGKSLLTDAVGMLLGNRGDRDLIRQGYDKAIVEGIFIPPFCVAINEILAEHSIDSDEIIITRELQSSGRSIARVNMRTVNLGFLKDLGSHLMNIHGQFEHITLMNEDYQLSLLDKFGGNEIASILDQVAKNYNEWRYHKNNIEKLLQSTDEQKQMVDFWEFQHKELTKAKLKLNEDEILQKKLKIMNSGKALFDYADDAFNSIYGTKGSGVMEMVYNAMESLKKISDIDEAVDKYCASLSDIYYSLEDVAEFVRDYRDKIDVDPQKIELMENRLATINSLQKKYKKDLAGLIEFRDDLEDKLSTYENFDDKIKELQSIERVNYELLNESLNELTSQRQIAAQKLSERITAEIKQLMLSDSCFKIDINDSGITSSGRDTVSFMVSMNKGEQLKPLNKVASGGEISRLLLGVKTILAAIDDVQSLIFDEIDSGMGGKAAQVVGEKLATISSERQVIAVTHSPLVAAFGNNHINIYKTSSEDRTVVKIDILNDEQTTKEIGRMLTGNGDDTITIKQSLALRNRAKEVKSMLP